MYNINQHIIKELYNKYGGSERKKTVLLDDGNVYMLKLSDPIREKDNQLSYINNAYSEYLGCKIAESMGLPVQKTILGEYTYKSRDGQLHTRPACLCKDIEKETGLNLIELDKLALSDYENNSRRISFTEQNYLISRIKNIDNEKLKEFYYNVFIFDALTGNTDRHNGNIAILTNSDESSSYICPVFDCGSSLLPLVNDEKIDDLNLNNLYLSICSVITENGKKINYTDYLSNVSNLDVDNALKRIVPRINLNTINNIIEQTDDFTDNRKEIYKGLLHARYAHVIIPAVERITGIKQIDYFYSKNISEHDLYKFYKNYIEQINEFPAFEQHSIEINKHNVNTMRLGKKYALILDNNKRIDGLINIRSNNNDIRKCIAQLSNYNPGLTKRMIDKSMEADYER